MSTINSERPNQYETYASAPNVTGTPSAAASAEGQAPHPNFDMNSLMLAFNKLISKMRDQQRDNALQHQQYALQQQEQAYNKQKESIASGKQASIITTACSITGASLGILGSGTKLTGSLAASHNRKGINKQLEAGVTGGPLVANLKRKEEGWTLVEKNADLATPVGGIITAGGQCGAASYTENAESQKVDAERFKLLQGANDKEFEAAEARARENSSQLRDTQRDLNALYAKMVDAVRF